MDIWPLIGNFASILQIVTVALTGYTAFRLWRQNQQIKILIQQWPRHGDFQKIRQVHEGIKSATPVALLISLLPGNNSIKPTVETFLNSSNLKMKVKELHMDGINGPQEIEQYVNKLKEMRQMIELEGYTEVHLFVAGPVQAASIAGALLDNWLPVKLYQKTNLPSPMYEYWMPLL